MSIYLGADGGGTKTAFILENNGTAVTLIKKTPANPTDIGYQASASNIRSGFTGICRENGINPLEVKAVFAGIAGATIADYKNFLKGEIAKDFPNSKIEVSHDAENIIYSAFPDGDGAAVICGTGSCCYVKKGGTLHRIGGYSVFDVLGCGFEIGKMVIAHTLRCIDGREKKGELYQAFVNKTGSDPLTMLPELLSLNKDGVAAYAALAFEAYEDTASQKIIDINMSHIAELIDTAANFFDGAFQAAIAGGIGKNPVAFGLIKSKVRVNADIKALESEPVYGSIQRAKRNL